MTKKGPNIQRILDLPRDQWDEKIRRLAEEHPSRRRQLWSPEEEEFLTLTYKYRVNPLEIARQLKKTTKAIYDKTFALGLTKRSDGMRANTDGHK